ncbi:MAG: type II toxin-antitoxin system RelE/ParE family toxin [Oscillospiraceae bacterium]|nr:type II toxin-antitoxin system RelE/ParE family toxin [Oscillospiraceae bacterium]
MYKLDLLPTAQRQKDKMLDYIKHDFYNPTAAKRINKQIDNAFMRIRRMPYSCPVYESDVVSEHEYRKLIVKNYIVLYWVDDDDKTITVARIFHGKQNYEDMTE